MRGSSVSAPPADVAVGAPNVAVGAPGVLVGLSVFVGAGVCVGGRRVFGGVRDGVMVGSGVFVIVGVAVNGAAPSKSMAVAVGTGWLMARSMLSWAAAATERAN